MAFLFHNTSFYGFWADFTWLPFKEKRPKPVKNIYIMDSLLRQNKYLFRCVQNERARSSYEITFLKDRKWS